MEIFFAGPCLLGHFVGLRLGFDVPEQIAPVRRWQSMRVMHSCHLPSRAVLFEISSKHAVMVDGAIVGIRKGSSCLALAVEGGVFSARWLLHFHDVNGSGAGRRKE